MNSSPLPGSLADTRKKKSPLEHRPLPSTLDGEKGVLCSALLDPNVIDDLGQLGSEHFHHPAHATIWGVLLEMRQARNPIDLVTVTQKIANADLLDQIGGPSVMAELQTFLPTSKNVEYYAALMMEAYMRRAIIRVAGETSQMSYESHDQPAEALLNEVEAKWLSLRAGTKTETAMRPMREYVAKAIDNIEYQYKNRGKILGIPTGLPDVDRMTGGFKAEEFVVIAGRPSQGKTALGMQIADYAAQNGFPGAVFSMEMSGTALASRKICSETPLDMNRLRDGFLKKQDFSRLNDVAASIAERKLWIDPTPALNVFEFRARTRRAVALYGIKFVLVDYLQLMKSQSRRSQENRAMEIAEVSMTMKAVAKEFGICVIALAQLGRSADDRAQPKMSDLRESGQIEQDADVIGLIYRPKYKQKNEDGSDGDDGTAIFDIVKQRDNPVGPVELIFDKAHTRFLGKTSELYSNNEEKRQKNFHR